MLEHLAAKAPVEAELPVEQRTLSPSDFGFHNALRRPDGRVVFLDLEYFGWDDPAKMISDFLLHPALERFYPPSKRIVIPERLTVCGGVMLADALDVLVKELKRVER